MYRVFADRKPRRDFFLSVSGQEKFKSLPLTRGKGFSVDFGGFAIQQLVAEHFAEQRDQSAFAQNGFAGSRFIDGQIPPNVARGANHCGDISHFCGRQIPWRFRADDVPHLHE
jgi:hypothetical protein